MDKLRLGFIGTGKIAQVRHIPEASERDDVEIIGYYNRTTEKAEKMAKKYGGKVYGSWEALLEDETIDAVIVSVANFLHAEITVRALRSGKHVLCEKPMAMNIHEAELMLEAALDTKKTLDIAHNQRLVPAHMRARKLLSQGRIGKVLSFRTAFGHGGPETWSSSPGKDVWFFSEEAAGMGAMADLGIHKTDLLIYLLGQNIVDVSGMRATRDKRGSDGSLIGVDDNAVCMYKMEDGALGTMTVSWTYYGPEDNSTVIYGTEGIMHILDDPETPLKVMDQNGEAERFDVSGIQTNENQTASGVMETFIAGIKSGEETIFSVKKIIPAMRAVFAAESSFTDGRTVTIEKNRRGNP